MFGNMFSNKNKYQDQSPKGHDTSYTDDDMDLATWDRYIFY